jgi:hypothetical protein
LSIVQGVVTLETAFISQVAFIASRLISSGGRITAKNHVEKTIKESIERRLSLLPNRT